MLILPYKISRLGVASDAIVPTLSHYDSHFILETKRDGFDNILIPNPLLNSKDP
jgi:hypothetical protein